MACQHNTLTGCSDCQAKATYAELGRVRDELHRTQQTLGLIAYAVAHLRPDEALRNLIANTIRECDCRACLERHKERDSG